jgi:hypothetical protein
MTINIGGWTINNTGLATKTVGSNQAIVNLNANGKFDVERISDDGKFKSCFDDFATALYNCEQWLHRRDSEEF